ncbi:MAG: prepilin peptidase [Anaeromyxobacteraceae bacterium]
MHAHFTVLDLLGTLLAAAVAADVASRRIPNALVLPLALGGLAAQWLERGPAAAGVAVLVALGVLALLVLPWMSGKLGGGDVKLIAATAIWIGPSLVLPFLVFTAVAGAPVACAARLVSFVRLRREAPRTTPHGCHPGALPAAQDTVPMAAAIALGAFAALFWGWP